MGRGREKEARTEGGEWTERERGREVRGGGGWAERVDIEGGQRGWT